MLGRASRFGLGFQLTQPERPLGPNPRSFGHFGAGGSLGFADPDAGLAFGYVMNRSGPRWQNPRNRALIDAVYGLDRLTVPSIDPAGHGSVSLRRVGRRRSVSDEASAVKSRGRGNMPHRPGRKAAGLLVVALHRPCRTGIRRARKRDDHERLHGTAAPIPCAVQGSGVRLCDQTIAGNPGGTRAARSRPSTACRSTSASRSRRSRRGPDGPYPLIMLFHGYAGSKLSLASMQPFLNAGYATFSMTTRGFGQSCGTATSRTELGAACDNGYVRLMDTRYEVRDAQELAGLLADEGRTSLHADRRDRRLLRRRHVDGAGALKNRKMLPDGSLTRVAEPERHADADRGGDAGDPVDGPGLLAASRTAARSTTSPTPPTRAAPAC